MRNPTPARKSPPYFASFARGGLIALLVLMACSVSRAADSAKRPNIVFILADDLGYGDLGCFGQTKIKTPVLDRLAREGMKFTQHYSGNAVCAPSRCVLMTGLHPGHAPIRDNRERKPEGQYPLAAETVTLPRLLQRAGYATGAFGKWGLGGPDTEGIPLKQGFGRHYGYNCQRVSHNFYPTHLWDDNRRIALNNIPFPAHDKLRPDEDPTRPESYARFAGKDYSADLIARQAIAFVEANKDRPFFLYWPTTVPHLALQVPEDSLREYEGKWEDPPYVGGQGYVPHFRPRAAYAAMISRMDREIGVLMNRLKELGLDEQTLFVFSSDNGPLYDRLGGTDSEFFDSHGGLNGRKGSLHEGGVRVPCVVRLPGKIAPGGVSERVSGFEDWLPTLAEIDGISLAPTLRGEQQPERPFLYREFPGYGGQQSVRVGRWKALRKNMKSVNPKAEVHTFLFDLTADPTESRDVSAEQPEILARLTKILAEQHRPHPEFPLPTIDR